MLYTCSKTIIARYAGCQYAVSCDCCSNALFLSLKYLESAGRLEPNSIIDCSSRTYVSVPMRWIIHAGHRIRFVDMEWDGIYGVGRYQRIRWIDVHQGHVHGWKRHSPVSIFPVEEETIIGLNCGMILNPNDKVCCDWLKLASYDGRDLSTYYPEDDFAILGWHNYMMPEDAVLEDCCCSTNYRMRIQTQETIASIATYLLREYSNNLPWSD